jgi:hypothetical protein
MRRAWIPFAIIAAVFIGIGTLFATTDIGPDRDWDDHKEVQTITRSDGTTETVTIERDGRDGPPFFFFPFGFLFFLIVFFAIMRFVFGGFRGGPWRGGPGGDGGPMRERFSQWHREEHEKMASQ